MIRICPGYHLVSGRFIKSSLSICNCARCACSDFPANSKNGDGAENRRHYCGRLLKCEDVPRGYAEIAWNGTCDASTYRKEDFSDFKLQC